MNGQSISVLLIEDNPGDARLVQEELAGMSDPSYRLECVDRLSNGLNCIAEGGLDVVLLDLGLPDSQGLGAVPLIHTLVPNLPIVVLSGAEDEQFAVSAVEAGAQDYLVKRYATSHLLTRAIRYAIERKRAEVELRASESRERERAAELEAIMNAAPAAIFVSHDPKCRKIIGNRMAQELRVLPADLNGSDTPGNDGAIGRMTEHGIDIPPSELPLQTAACTGKPVMNCQFELAGAGGVTMSLLGNAVPIKTQNGSVQGAVGVFVDITDLKRAEDDIQQSNLKLQQLSRDLLRTQDYERRRIARELHDSTAQLLTGLTISLSRLRDPTLKAGRKSEALSEAIQLAHACSQEIRTVTYLLHPPLLEEIGLEGAIKSYAEGFNQRTGIDVEVRIPSDFGRLGLDLEGALFRIVQEGLANIHKHSGSRSAVISLKRDSNEVRLALRDRGRGLPPGMLRQDGFVHFGVGIMGMRERAAQLGGRLELLSNNGGLTLTVAVPLEQSNEEDANSVGR